MDWFLAAMVGAAGGASMEAVDIIKAIKWHHQWPWNVRSESVGPSQPRADVRRGEENLPAPGWKAYCVAAALRVLVSGALTGVVAATYPSRTNPLMAFLIGLGALSAVQQASTLVPLMVKSAGRSALGGGSEGGGSEGTQQPSPTLPQNGPQSGSVQSNGAPPEQRTGPPSEGNPQPDTDVAAQQDPAGQGGAV